MPDSIAFDLTRLITRLRHASPTGIDRVDLAYARHLLDGPGARFGLVTTPFGPRVLDRAAAGAIVAAVAAGWVEDRAAEDDPVYRRLVADLGGTAPAPTRAGADAASGSSHDPSHVPSPGAARRRRIRAEAALRVLRGRGPEALPPGTVYLHSSHLRLDRPARFDWLYDRPDIRAVFFVHDLIPISHPEYGRPGEAARHAGRMRTVARHAAQVLVNSADVGARLRAHLAAHGLGAKPVAVAPLGVEPAFAERGGAPPRLDRPTFVVCSTIESRKNHLLLLQVWRALAERLGPATPCLVLVGRRGWEAESAIDLLDRCPSLRPHVREVAGLSTRGLARLMRGATALLMPSFVEGYGLPLVEAAAAGLPVLASDIPVHREVAGDFARLIDPLDGPGWTRAVEALSAPGSSLRAELAAPLAGYVPPSWAAHFAIADAALAGLSDPSRRAEAPAACLGLP